MLPFTHKLAVASFARSMKIYDLSTYELCGQVSGMHLTGTCIGFRIGLNVALTSDSASIN